MLRRLFTRTDEERKDISLKKKEDISLKKLLTNMST